MKPMNGRTMEGKNGATGLLQSKGATFLFRMTSSGSQFWTRLNRCDCQIPVLFVPTMAAVIEPQ